MSALIWPSCPEPAKLPFWLLPVWAICAVLSLPIWLPAEWMCKHKVRDHAFHNTVRFGFKLILTPIVFAVWAVVFFMTLPWWLALALLAVYIPSFSIFYDLRLK